MENESSDIILIGAGRSPHTKQLRQATASEWPKIGRSFYVGEIQIRPHVRIPVDEEFLQKHFDQIVLGVRRGVLLVEYKYDTYVDPDELTTLAFGSEEEKEAYRERSSKETLEAAENYQTISNTLAVQTAREYSRSALSRMPVARPDSDNIPVAHPDGNDPEEPQKEGAAATNPFDPHTTSPRDLAQQAQLDEANRTPVDPNAQVPANPVEPEGEPRTIDELDPGNYPVQQTPDGQPLPPVDQGPLPEGWDKLSKNELLGLCAERGIDTSDMPTNRELRKRLEASAR